MVYEFADFVLDEERFTLTYKSGATVPLQMRALELLILLVRNAGTTVTKDAILREIWGRENVSRSALPTQVLNLRRALGDTEEPYKLIQTIPSKGLRFCGQAKLSQEQEELAMLTEAAALPLDFEYASAESTEYLVSPVPIAQSAPTSPAPDGTEREQISYAKLRYLFAALAVAVLIAIGIYLYTSPFDNTQTAVEKKYNASLAVMPFREIGERGEAYLGEGIALSLASEISRFETIKVTSSTSTFRFSQDSSAQVGDIAEALNVDYLIEGTFSRQDDALRVSVELIDASADRRIWSQSYDRPFTADSFLRIQDEIVGAIASGVLGSVSQTQAKPLVFSTSAEAIDLYFEAKSLRVIPTAEVTSKRANLLNQAISLDEAFVSAYAELALTYSDMLLRGGDRQAEAFDLMEQSLERALEIDPAHPHVLAASGAIADENGELRKAVGFFQRAIALAPQNAELMVRLALVYQKLNRELDERSWLRRAREYDPLNAEVLGRLTLVEFGLGNTRDAFEVAEANLLINGSDPAAQVAMSSLLVQTGDYNAGHDLIIKLLQSNPGAPELVYFAERLYARVGMVQRAIEIAEQDPLSEIRYAALRGERNKVVTFVEDHPEIEPIGDLHGVWYFYLGDFDAALPLLKATIDQSNSGGAHNIHFYDLAWYLAHAHVLTAQNDSYGDIILSKIEDVASQYSPETSPSFVVSIAAAGAEMLSGNQDNAIDWLEAAVDQGHTFLDLTMHPTFEPLKDNDRYKALRIRMEQRAADYRAQFESTIAEYR